MVSPQHISFLYAVMLMMCFWYCSLLWDLPAVQIAQSIFEYLSSFLTPKENKSPVLNSENGRCFMDLLYVFRCSFQKYFKNRESG